MFEQHSGIVLACDVESLDALSSLAKLSEHAPTVVGFKVGFSIALRFGLSRAVEVIRVSSDLPIIYDHQKAGTDIPQMGQQFARVCSEADVQAVILFPHAGPKTLEAFVSSAFEHGLVPIVGLSMTHPAYLQSDGGFIADEAPQRICELAVGLGVKCFVLPGTKPKLVAQFAAGPLASVEDAAIMMPGIGRQGGDIASAFRAAKPHQRYAIIGSAIYKSQDPLAAVKSFVAEIQP